MRRILIALGAVALLFAPKSHAAGVHQGLPDIVDGTLDFGTGTVVQAGNVATTLGLTVTQSFDSATAPSDSRNVMFQTTLSPDIATTNIVENANSFVYINGPGAQQGEVNLSHTYTQINSGASVEAVEGYEASMSNSGAILGYYIDFLGLAANQTTSVANTIFGEKFQLSNYNTTPGSVTTYAALDFEQMAGGGSLPTYYYLIRSADQNAVIATMGRAVFGSINGGAADAFITAIGPDVSPNTNLLDLISSDGTHRFVVTDGGTLTINNTFGVSCTGSPTASYATVNGIVTHC